MLSKALEQTLWVVTALHIVQVVETTGRPLHPQSNVLKGCINFVV